MDIPNTSRYKILEQIGYGGMGSVYLGKDRETNATVVIKIVEGIAGFPEPWEREFDIISSLNHINIIKVYDKFTHNGQLYFVMEKIDGVPLFRAIPPFNEGGFGMVASRAFGQLHEALNYIHEHGIVHCGLTPWSILIDQDGILKIIDFECCRAMNADEKARVVGIPTYMSPEHLEGKIIPESDYFVVGTLLAEFVTGLNPFRGDRYLDTFLRIQSFDREFIASKLPRLPGGLRRTVVSLLAREPAVRRQGWVKLGDVTRRGGQAATPLTRVAQTVRRGIQQVRVSPSRDNSQSPRQPLTAIEIFFCYSHTDEKQRDRLEKHLSALKRQGFVAGWHDRRIDAGADWRNAIDEHLNNARLILLLVSSDFLHSDYCYDVEMRRALERHDAGEARVIPVILRPCDWHNAPFAKLQALPRDCKPITLWSNQDEAFLDVAKGIRKFIEELTLKP